jgi:hypothetical protein
MKRWVPIYLFGLLLFACSIPSTIPTQTATPSQTSVTETSLVTEIPTETTAPVITEQPAPATNVSCNELELFLDPALASGFNCESITESSEGLEVHPQNSTVTLQGYVLSGKFFTPHISVYPVQRYTELLPDTIPAYLSALQSIVSNSSCPAFTGSFNSSLPFLPVFNASQVFFAECQVISFVGGNGIRYLTEFAQYYAVVNNYDLFYTYQGITSDGNYWVSAILPINNPILPDNGDNPPDGMTMEEFSANYEPYLMDVIDQLNSQPSDSYNPTLTALDELVSSIIIHP